MEVVMFPEAARNTGEGHYAWDLLPSSMMTNANVDTIVTGEKVFVVANGPATNLTAARIVVEKDRVAPSM
jgi:hypothetical protein